MKDFNHARSTLLKTSSLNTSAVNHSSAAVKKNFSAAGAAETRLGTACRGRATYGGKDRHSPLREVSINRERRERYHASRLATEVALLKFNTPYEKREHSPGMSFQNRTKSTAVNTSCAATSAAKIGGADTDACRGIS